MKKMITSIRTLSLILLSLYFAAGCANEKRLNSSVDRRVYEVQSKLYIFGARHGKKKPWFIAAPVFDLGPVTNEYENGSDPLAKYWSWQIYNELDKGDRIQVQSTKWINGNAYSGYNISAKLLTGAYKGATVDLMELVLSGDTQKPVEEWNPATDPVPSPQGIHVNPRYLKEIPPQNPDEPCEKAP